MKTILTADWAPVIEAAIRRLAQLCTVVYVAGYMTGEWIHRLNDALAATVCAPAPQPVLVVAPVIATTRHAMPTGIDHARHLVAAGHSQRQAARRAGVSRTSLQRALAAA